MSDIYLFTAPVKAGKTTQLMQWAQDKPNLGGILAPDVEGLRQLYTLRDRQWHPFQITDEQAGHQAAEDMVVICKFNFLADTFALARQCLLDDATRPFDWLLVDEVGKLELKGKGLEPAIGPLIRHFQTSDSPTKLLLVVREELLDEAIQHYALSQYHLLRFGEPLPE